MSKHIELAKKLKALADKGVGGEKVNAEKMLSDFMRKHNISIDDIESDKRIQFFFKIEEGYVGDLFNQIVKNVNFDIVAYQVNKTQAKRLKLVGDTMIECTHSDYIEIKSKYDFFKDLFKSELAIFYGAFVQANSLWATPPETKERKYTDKEIEIMKRELEMASKIKKGIFHKQIEG